MTKSKGAILIEDNQAIIDVYSIALKTAGIDLEVIKLGRDAIKEMEDVEVGKREKPKLVLLDLLLPDVNGMDVLKKIKESNALKDIAVFVLSNYTNSQLSEMGCPSPDRFILKTSITPTELAGLVKKQLKPK